MDRISIIVPAYNAEKFIKRCVDSLCTQVCQHYLYSFEYEVIVVNDGSKDSTLSVLNNLSQKYSNLRVLDKPNGGAASARKYGIEYSTSDFLAFCDADDFVDNDWLISMYVFLKRYEADVSICMAYLNNNETNYVDWDSCNVIEWTKENVHESFVEHLELNGSLVTKLFKRDLFNGLVWNLNLKMFEDDFLVWQILYKVEKIVKFKIRKYHYLFTQNSLTRQIYDKDRYNSFKIFLERLVLDSSKMKNPMVKEKALDLQYKWIAIILGQHVISGYKDNEARDYMIEILRRGGIKRWRSLLDLRRKLFVGCTIMFPNLSSIIFQKIKR